MPTPNMSSHAMSGIRPGLPGNGNISMVSRPPATGLELIRKAHVKLCEKLDVTKCRHKPLSILRQEGRRVLEQFFEIEGTQLIKADRDRLVEDILAEAMGFSPLEELLRDDAIREVMILGPSQIIARKKEGWMPTSVQFRDGAQLRGCLTRWSETGTAVTTGTAAAGFDVRLNNGFRVVGIVPPENLDRSPIVLFIRPEVPTNESSVVTLTSVHRTPQTDRPGMSTTQKAPVGGTTNSAAVLPGISRVMPAPNLNQPDSFTRLRQRVSSWIISRCASAGVYDLSQIPAADLQKVIHAHLLEVCEADRLNLDMATVDRLSLEILAGLKRG